MNNSHDGFTYNFSYYTQAYIISRSSSGQYAKSYADRIYVTKSWDNQEVVYEDVFDSYTMDINTFKAGMNARLAEYNDNDQGYRYYLGHDGKNYYQATDAKKLEGCETVTISITCNDGAKLGEGSTQYKCNSCGGSPSAHTKECSMATTLTESSIDTSELDSQCQEAESEIALLQSQIDALEAENSELLKLISQSREELNVEKTGFLKNLVMLIWKGTQGNPTKTEERLIEQVISEYYDVYFNGFKGFTPPQRDDLRKSLIIDDRNRHANTEETVEAKKARIEGMIDEIERKRKELKVKELSFNSFYEFSVQRIPDICQENSITSIDVSTYRYMMKDFYRGGNHDKTLNEDLDSTLFDETFIVFEIDSIKDDPLLFPLVTLIIMDVFIQKMRIKKNRKVLVIEEAWKAIASPMMAEYIKYLYKTARKFWASVGVVTQEIQDIVGSPIVKEAIINNSDVVMLLDQSKFRERFDEIQSILGLTDVDCKKIFTINRLENKEGRSFFREVYIRRGAVGAVFGVEEPRECYMTYTTERAEKEALKLYKKELNCDHQHAIEAYVRDWNRSGISKSLPFAQKVNQAGHVLNLKPNKTAIA